MSFETRVLNVGDIPMILEFENQRLAEIEPDPVERELISWHSRWRKESLEHYLPLGWSFALFSGQGSIEGYFLAQPLLFFRGMTQNLWIEQLSYSSSAVASQLIELAYKWGRDKHLQKLLLPAEEQPLCDLLKARSAKQIDDRLWEIPTAKIREVQ